MMFRWLIALGLLFTGCAKMELSDSEYRAWIAEPDNGLSREEQQNFLKVSIKYMPDDYVALLDCKAARPAEDCLSRRKQEIIGQQYYQFRLALNDPGETDLLKYGISSPTDYSYRVQYCSSHLQGDLELEENGRRYPCKLLHFERTYGMAPYLSFLAVFDRSPQEQKALKANQQKINDKTFYYNDQLFNLGTIKLSLSGSDLTALPRLKP